MSLAHHPMGMSSRQAQPSQTVATPVGHQWSPYDSNGGSILAIAGPDFCVVAGDTRQSTGYNIQTRYKPKVFRLNDKATLATNGFSADAEALVDKIKQRLIFYRHNHGTHMPLASIARLVSNLLYGKRFFPYYVYNILGGVDEDGKGAVYSFDPVGSHERETCRAAGAAQSLLQPFLDNQIMYRNQQPLPDRPIPQPGLYDLPTVLRVTMDSFTSATERHIEVGDGLEMFIVRNGPTSEGDQTSKMNLPELFGAVEAVGGEEEQTPGVTMVVRRELKKD
ncbi:unnamed protein product [Sympodiomycopsis kandeliae]